jgi:NAD(P)-dependent dehydrogenase (short-subunit alcohol dehydrogenase family)
MENKDYFDLTNKVALITGGAGMLGLEHATAILEKSGSVILVDRDAEALDLALDQFPHNHKSRVRPLCLDVTSEEAVRAATTQLMENSDQIDVLINNAAVNPKVGLELESGDPSRLESFDIERWHLELSVGLTGAFICAKHFGGYIAAQGRGGVILNISSDLSVISPDQRLYAIEGREPENQPVKPITYSVVKTGLIGLTRYLATYWVNDGVRANALSPGGVLVDQAEQFRLRLEQLIPMGRMASKHEYRGAIQFLCSDASSYLNGQNIVMDGGRSIW